MKKPIWVFIYLYSFAKVILVVGSDEELLKKFKVPSDMYIKNDTIIETFSTRNYIKEDLTYRHTTSFRNHNKFEDLKVCDSFIHVDEDPENHVKKYKDCEVIWGNIEIEDFLEVFDPHGTGNIVDVYKNFTLPKLKHVAGYILIQSKYLYDLGKVFPNLVSIGGKNLFVDKYALVVVKTNSASIGLSKLQRIERGAVKIGNNPRMCFLNTVDWIALTVKENKLMKASQFYGNGKYCKDKCDEKCTSGHCWGPNSHQCQKACPAQCPDSCTEDGECGCHSLCHGICKRPNDPSGCIVCNQVGKKGEIGYLDKNLTCVESCPPKTLRYSESLNMCVTSNQCAYELGSWYYNASSEQGKCFPNKFCPFGWKLVVDKPFVYQRNYTIAHPLAMFCRKCEGQKLARGEIYSRDNECFKECPCPEIHMHGNVQKCPIVQSWETSQFRGCNYIKGILSFNFHENSNAEYALLEKNFRNLVTVDALEIKGPLTTVDFLQNLNNITGHSDIIIDPMYNSPRNYSFAVYLTTNLKTLWFLSPYNIIGTNKNTSLSINGKSLLIKNNKLCKQYVMFIRQMQNVTDGSDEISDFETSSPSCKTRLLNITATPNWFSRNQGYWSYTFELEPSILEGSSYNDEGEINHISEQKYVNQDALEKFNTGEDFSVDDYLLENNETDGDLIFPENKNTTHDKVLVHSISDGKSNSKKLHKLFAIPEQMIYGWNIFYRPLFEHEKKAEKPVENVLDPNDMDGFIRVPLPSDKLKIIVDPFLPGKTYAYYAKAVVKNREDADNWESEMQYLTTRANAPEPPRSLMVGILTPNNSTTNENKKSHLEDKTENRAYASWMPPNGLPGGRKAFYKILIKRKCHKEVSYNEKCKKKRIIKESVAQNEIKEINAQLNRQADEEEKNWKNSELNMYFCEKVPDNTPGKNFLSVKEEIIEMHAKLTIDDKIEALQYCETEGPVPISFKKKKEVPTYERTDFEGFLNVYFSTLRHGHYPYNQFRRLEKILRSSFYGYLDPDVFDTPIVDDNVNDVANQSDFTERKKRSLKKTLEAYSVLTDVEPNPEKHANLLEHKNFEAPLLRKRRQDSTSLSESSTENREHDINEGENEDVLKYDDQPKYGSWSPKDRPVYIKKEYGNSSDNNLIKRVKKYGEKGMFNFEPIGNETSELTGFVGSEYLHLFEYEYKNMTKYPYPLNNLDPVCQQLQTNDSGKCEEEYFEVITYKNNHTFENLCHHTKYEIEVVACVHDWEGAVWCTSEGKKGNFTTFPYKYADVVRNVEIYMPASPNGSDWNVRVVKFDPPEYPNGNIKFYTIEYEIEGSKELHTQCCTLQYYESNNRTCMLENLQGGDTKARVLATSTWEANEWNYSPWVEFTVIAPRNYNYEVTVACLTTLIIIVGVVCVYFYKRSRAASKKPVWEDNLDYGPWYKPDAYEIPFEKIEIMQKIGTGHFGEVFEGLAKDVVAGESQTRVAIKTLHNNENTATRLEFLKEANTMKEFVAYHVVRLIGVVSQHEKPLVVMEFMSNGDLKNFLRNNRPEDETSGSDCRVVLSDAQKMRMCIEIADGMAYLTSKKFVHRDLAARNCLVDENLTVKVGDFGLARDVYERDYYRIDRKGEMPVRWMSPESLRDGLWDHATDVWSYGVVLWEIATYAQQPYQGRPHESVTKYVMDGGFLSKPAGCHEILCEMMMYCFAYNPEDRPTFMKILELWEREDIDGCLNDQFITNSYYFTTKMEASPEKLPSNDFNDLLGNVYTETAPMLPIDPLSINDVISSKYHGNKAQNYEMDEIRREQSIV